MTRPNRPAPAAPTRGLPAWAWVLLVLLGLPAAWVAVCLLAVFGPFIVPAGAGVLLVLIVVRPRRGHRKAPRNRRRRGLPIATPRRAYPAAPPRVRRSRKTR